MTGQGDSAVAAIEAAIHAALGRALGADENFFDAGLTSRALVSAHAEGTRGLSAPPPVTVLFAHPNLRALRRYLAGPAAAAPPERGSAGRRELRRRARGEVA